MPPCVSFYDLLSCADSIPCGPFASLPRHQPVPIGNGDGSAHVIANIRSVSSRTCRPPLRRARRASRP